MQDRELVERLAAGEAGAWRTFVERDGPLVAGLVRRALHVRGIAASDADVDDLVGAVFTALVDRERHLVRSFKFGCSWRSWLAIVASGRIGHWLRSRKKTRSLDEALAQEDLGDGPEDVAVREERCAKLRAAIEKLPDRDRVALRLFYEEKLSRDEVGKALGVSAAHAGVILDRARRKLRDLDV